MVETALRLLVVADETELAAPLAGAFERQAPGAVVTVAASASSAPLDERDYDAILLALGGERSMLDTLAVLRARQPAAAIVLVAGGFDDELAVRAAAAGAQDCLACGSFSDAALVRAVRSAVARQRLALDRERSQALRTQAAQVQAFVEGSLEAQLVLDAKGVVRFANPAAERLFDCPLAALVGAELGAPLIGSRPVELELTGASGREVEAWAVATQWEGHPVQLLSLHDLTSRRQAQAALEARVRQQAAVAELGTAAVAAHELAAFFDHASELVALTLEVDSCGVLEGTSGHGELAVRAGFGWREGIVGPARIEAGPGSLSGFTLRSGGPVVVSDLASETRFRVHPELVAHGVTSSAAVLVVGDAGPWGVLTVHSRAPRTFTTDDLHFLSAVSNVLGSVVARQRAEEALREKEARFRGVADSLAEGLLLSDLDRRITYVNPRLAEMTGFRSEEIVGKRIEEAPYFAEDPRLIEERTRRRALGLAEEIEARLRRADGSLLWVRIHAAPFRDASQRIVGAVAAFSDVTERRTAERARAEAEARLLQVMERSPAVLYAVTPTAPHAVTWMSANAVRILGFAPEDFRLLPDLWRQRTHPEDVVKIGELLDMLQNEDESATCEYRFLHADGRWLWVSDTTSVVRDGDGRALEIVGACQDVTTERQLEEQLRQAQKMEAVGRLAGGIAHDFNNLLTAIGGYSELLLLRLGEEDPARHEVEEIRRAGERAAALTRQLLTFSRRQVLQPRVLNVNAAIADTERMLRRLIGEDVRLTTAPSSGALLVKVDPGQLEQVVVNLAVNARDAMPRGGRLTLSTGLLESAGADGLHPQAKAGRWVWLRAADTGCGMEPEVLARVFEPFFTTKDVGKGTGLGLSTVYGIVQQSGGWIEVESEPGQGAAFTVFLPEVAEPESVAPPREARPHGGVEVVLVVEDEAAVRALVCTTLRGQGYVVLEASNGGEALELVVRHEGRIDLLLTDVVMPDLRGPELRERLLLHRPGLPTVFMSGYSENAEVPEVGEGIGFVQKPFTPEGLARALREVLDWRPVSGDER